MTTTLTSTDLAFVVRRIPKDIRAQITEFGLILGGGFIRETIAGNRPVDIDLFGPNHEILNAASSLLTEQRDARIHLTDNARTVLCPPRLPVQYITRWMYERPADVLSSFDFTVCQAVIFFRDGQWQSLCSPNFYPDLAARRLVYTAPVREEAAGGSMMRVRKMLARGYNIQADSLAYVIARVVSGVRNIQDLPEKEVGMVVSGLLREVDPMLLVDGLDVGDEHEQV